MRLADVAPQCAQLPGPDLRDGNHRIGKHQRDVSGKDVGHRWRVALVRHVQHLDPGERLEQLRIELVRRTRPAGRVGELARIALRAAHQFGHGLNRQQRMQDEHERNVRNEFDRREVLGGDS